MNFGLLATPIISAFIGWFTTWLAIKMLFHPRKPKRVLGLTVQGIFPKNQQQFAVKLGKLVGEELLSFKEIAAKITNPENVEQLMPFVEEHVDNFLRVKLPQQMPVVSMFIGDKTTEQLKAVFMDELRVLFPQLMEKYVDNLQNELELEKIVIEKVSLFSSNKLEEVLSSVMSKEFRFVEMLCAVLGFIIGLLQVLVALL